MITPEKFSRLQRALPFLHQAEIQMQREFQSRAFFARLPAGADVFVEGDQADALALLISGVVRVYKIGESGREITLYRFGHGQSCILTANAILSCKSFPALATVEQAAEAVMVPAEAFREWVKRHDGWREFVFDLLSDRLVAVLTIIDEVVFQRLDRRLAAWLLAARQTRSAQIRVTHQEIAAELGSSREVISRILEDFSQRGLIETSRGSIEILSAEELNSVAVM